MFYDKARIYVKSGNGGDGMISFRREKYVPRGGPDGGDGGKGGDVIMTVDTNVSSLVRFHKQVHFEAEDGSHGQPKNQTGASGEDLILKVPPGTIVRDAETGEMIADMVDTEQSITLLKGGEGGKGNVRFANSTNRAPRLAERGVPGEERWLTLELKLIADVGIIGVPNAGKSTLLSVVSAARPKVAAYPFTTLQPNLGVVEFDDHRTMILADIPGLIEGASEGVGLGYEFLRHIERTRVLIHLLDGMSRDPLEDWAMINQELALYDARLEDKPQLLVLNKIDLPDAAAWESLIREQIDEEETPLHAISAVTGEGVQEMLYKVRRMAQEEAQKADEEATQEPAQAEEEDLPVIRPQEVEAAFSIFRLSNGSWRVRGKKIERIAAQTYFEFNATAMRFQHILDEMGISDALREAGVQEGDTVIIGDEVLEWIE